MPGISVIIPTYNRASFLLRALNSVARQTRNCDEIIVVDDGSTDNSRDCVGRFSKDFMIPVRYYYQENKGPAAARNYGISEAQYPYLAFLDSDDHWHKNKLELQFKALSSKSDHMISHTKESWLRLGKHLNQKKIHQPGNGNIFKHCLKLCAVGMSTVMVKREIFKEVGLFNEKLRCCEDYDLWLRTSSRFPFLLIETPLTIKEGGRHDQVSYQFRVGMDRLRISAILDLLQNNILSEKQTKWTLEELQKKCLVYGNGCLKHKKILVGQSYLEIAQWAEKCLDNDLQDPLHVPESLKTVSENQ
jgi:glycosyltransferase involved in cell wall biosynthesis